MMEYPKKLIYASFIVVLLMVPLAALAAEGDETAVKPTAKIVSISPSPATEAEEVYFLGSGSGGTIINYSWTSDKDGYLSNAGGFSTDSLSAGTHTITFRVQNDNNTWSDAVSRSLTINEAPNQKPVATINSISPNPATEGEAVLFRGSGTDEDGIINDYKWTSSIDGQLSTDARFTVSDLSAGTHIITFSVRDDDSEWSSTVSSTFTVVTPNKAPVASIKSITPNPAIVGTTVSFEGSANDSDGTVQVYKWTSSIDGELSSSVRFNTSRLSVGNHTISFTVQDNDNTWSEKATGQLLINETPNIKPVVSIESVTPDPAIQNQSVVLKGNASDADGTITGYNWTSDIDGYLSNQSAFETSNLSLGNHSISFSAQDDKGEWSEKALYNLSVIVTPNAIPNATIVSITPNPADRRVSVSFTGSGNDTDGTVVAYCWNSSIDGYLGNSSSFSSSNLSAGNHTIYFSVQDDKGTWSEKTSANLTINDVPNKVPLASIESVSPSPGEEHRPIYFSGKGNDSDGTIAAWLWASSLDGIIGRSASFNVSDLSVGNHIISFMVMDNEGTWSEKVYSTLAINAADNIVPVATINYISPNPASRGNTVELNGSGSDSFGYITDYEWNSSIDGYLGNASTLYISTLSVGTHTIYFKVKDNEGAWSLAQSMDMLVEDGAPFVSIDAAFTENIGVNNPVNITLNSSDMSPGITTFTITDSAGAVVLAEDLTEKIKSGEYTFIWNASSKSGKALPDGSYTMSIISMDTFENVNSSKLQVTVDNTPPSIVFGTVEGVNTVDRTVYTGSELNVAASENSNSSNAETVNFVLSSVSGEFLISTAASRNNGNWTGSFDIDAIPDDGYYLLEAVAEDAAHNSNTTISDMIILIDRNSPEIYATVSELTGNTAVIDIGSNEILDGIPLLTVNGVPLTAEETDEGWNAVFSFSDNGLYTLGLSAADLAGNTGNAETSVYMYPLNISNGTGYFTDTDGAVLINFSADTDVSERIAVSESESPFIDKSSGSIGLRLIGVQPCTELENILSSGNLFIRINEADLPEGIGAENVSVCSYDADGWKELPTDIVENNGTQYWTAELTEASLYAVIARDNVAPVLVSVSPVSGTSYGESTDSVEVLFRYADMQTGIDKSSIVFTFDGQDLSGSSDVTVTGSYALYNVSGPGAGSHYASLSVADNAGNSATFSTKFTISKGSSSGGSSSSSSSSKGHSGGSSGSSSEDYDNIIVKEARSIFINKGEHIIYEFSEQKNAISSIQFDSLKNSGKIQATIEVLNGTSSYADSLAPGNIYQQMNIFVGKTGFVNQDNVGNITISFKVDNSWMEANNVESGEVKLYRYNDELWQQLPTAVTDTDSEYTYFESSTSGFSPFAISSVKSEKTVSQAKEDSGDMITDKLNSADEEDSGMEEQELSVRQESKYNSSFIMIAAAGLIALILVGAFIVYRYVDIEL